MPLTKTVKKISSLLFVDKKDLEDSFEALTFQDPRDGYMKRCVRIVHSPAICCDARGELGCGYYRGGRCVYEQITSNIPKEKQ